MLCEVQSFRFSVCLVQGCDREKGIKMRRYLIAFFALSCVFGACAMTNEVVFFEQVEEEDLSFDEDEYKTLEDVEIGGTRIDDYKNRDTKKKYEVLEVNTYQPGYDEVIPGFRMHVVAEITDKAKNTYLIDFTAPQPEGLDSEFTGECYWSLYIDHGDLERPKMTAFAVHYGIMDDEDGYIDGEDRFVVIAEDYDDVDSMEELLERSATPYEGEFYLKFYSMFEDPTEGEMEDIPKTYRKSL